MKAPILIIDDEEKLRGLLSRIISLEGFTVSEAANAKEGLKKLEHEEFDIVICDVKLPDINGIELTHKIKSIYPLTEVIVLTAFGTIADGVKAIKHGAFDYITKGDDNDKIIPLVMRAAEKAALQRRVHQLEKKVERQYSFENIIGTSGQIREAIILAKKVAGTDTTVLLLGETGTGKEIFAQAIHYNGTRRSKNFVALNCAALSKEILESELFGYKAGAFTGAVKDKKGLFEEADEGTIFLDEIGEMSLDLQTKLLRVLESKEFISVGDTKTIRVNARIIAASNRNLENDVDQGKFRSDLFYRLAVFQITLPPLRERAKDIIPLAEHFINIYFARMNKPTPRISDGFLDRLGKHQWKGNVRELKNILERTAIMSEGAVLSEDDLPIDLRYNSQDAAYGTFDLALIEKQHIQKVMSHTKGNKTEAAKLMNIGLTTLYRKMEEYKINS